MTTLQNVISPRGKIDSVPKRSVNRLARGAGAGWGAGAAAAALPAACLPAACLAAKDAELGTRAPAAMATIRGRREEVLMCMA